MIVTTALLHIKPERIDDFKAACLANAAKSRQEPGITQFDLLQQQDDPTRFMLFEVYADADAVAAHKTTEQYFTWRAAVEDMQAEPRHGIKYDLVEH